MAMKHAILATFTLVMLVAPPGCVGGDIGTDSSDHRGVCLIDGETKTLHTGEYWILQEGYAIRLAQIDINGTKAWVVITKDGTRLDSMIIHLHDTGSFTKSIDIHEQDLILSIEASKISKSTEEAVLLVYQYSDDTKATRGFISITSSPQGAIIYLDDEYAGRTPMTLTGVLPCSHAIRLKTSGYEDYTETVSVSAGEETIISASLSASAVDRVEETPEGPDEGRMMPDSVESAQESDVAVPSSTTSVEAVVPAPMPGAASAIIGLMIATIVIGMKKRRRPPRITSYRQFEESLRRRQV